MKSLRALIQGIPGFATTIRKVEGSHARIENSRRHIDPERLQACARDADYVKESRAFLKRYFKGYTDVRWHLLYAAINGIKSPEYIPFDLWGAVIEPQINPPRMAQAYCDKNIHDRILNYSHVPRTFARFYDHRLWDAQYQPMTIAQLIRVVEEHDDRVVMKPCLLSHTGCGRELTLLESRQVEATVKSLSPEGSYLFQAYMEQHPDLGRFHECSINTMRIMTIQVDGEYRVLTAMLRIGVNQRIVDNVGAGGLFVGIDSTGLLGDFALDKNCVKHESHPNSGIRFSNQRIPGYDKVTDLVTQLHRHLYPFTIVSWDVAVTKQAEPIVIEYNLFDVIITMQFHNGPLLGPYADQVLSRIKRPRYLGLVSSGLFGRRQRSGLRQMKRGRI